MIDPIAEFDAFVSKVMTLADGSPRVVFDMGEDRTDLLTTLAKTRADDQMLTVLIFDSEQWKQYLSSISRQKETK